MRKLSFLILSSAMFAVSLLRCGNLLQRCRKSNAEYQAGLYIMLRCSNLLQRCRKSNAEYQAGLYIMLRCGNLLQRCRKSNAEYQACLNIMLRCSLSYAKKVQTESNEVHFNCRGAACLLQRYAFLMKQQSKW